MGSPDPLSRRARHEAKRQRRRNIVVASIATTLVAAGGATYALTRDSASGTSVNAPSTIGHSTTTDRGTSPIDRIVSEHPPRALSHDAPLRLWIGGDSLSGGLGISLGDQLSDTGIVDVTVDYKVGSGLHDNGLRNWPKRVPEQMEEHDPEVAVFMVGANDASIVSSTESAWAPEYRDKVATMMDLLEGDANRTVYWVGPPPLQTPRLERGTLALSELMRDEAAEHDNVVFIDAYEMFSDEDGHYTSRIDMPDIDKTNVRVRIGDGVHFTNDGADWLAYNIAKLLDRQWRITQQAGGKAISVSIESNGESVPGYRPNNRTTTTAGVTTSTSTDPDASTTTSDLGPTTTVAESTTTVPTGPTTTAPPPTTTVGP